MAVRASIVATPSRRLSWSARRPSGISSDCSRARSWRMSRATAWKVVCVDAVTRPRRSAPSTSRTALPSTGTRPCSPRARSPRGAAPAARGCRRSRPATRSLSSTPATVGHRVLSRSCCWCCPAVVVLPPRGRGRRTARGAAGAGRDRPRGQTAAPTAGVGRRPDRPGREGGVRAPRGAEGRGRRRARLRAPAATVEGEPSSCRAGAPQRAARLTGSADAHPRHRAARHRPAGLRLQPLPRRRRRPHQRGGLRRARRGGPLPGAARRRPRLDRAGGRGQAVRRRPAGALDVRGLRAGRAGPQRPRRAAAAGAPRVARRAARALRRPAAARGPGARPAGAGHEGRPEEHGAAARRHLRPPHRPGRVRPRARRRRTSSSAPTPPGSRSARSPGPSSTPAGTPRRAPTSSSRRAPRPAATPARSRRWCWCPRSSTPSRPSPSWPPAASPAAGSSPPAWRSVPPACGAARCG